MKPIFILLFLTSTPSFADGKSAKICDSLYDEAIYNCQVSMCEDWLKDEGTPINKETIAECIANSDGDLMEGAQICAVDGGEFEALVKAYNKKNPAKKISCEN